MRNATRPTSPAHAATTDPRIAPACGAGSPAAASPVSELTHWPVQLRLLPPTAPVLRNAALLIAADCVPVAYGAFQQHLLRGRAVLIGCPKFDDLESYVAKLTEIFRRNELREVVVARMEVPCCRGIVAAVVEARQRAGAAVSVTEVIVGTQGEVQVERPIPVAEPHN